MTRLERQAFDFADDNCPWCKGEENPEGFCDASALMKGYMSGFQAAREELARYFKGWVYQTHLEQGLVNGPKTLSSGPPTAMSDMILALGEEQEEPRPFAIGDRVRFLSTDDGTIPYDAIGIVKDVSPGNVPDLTVDFPGHTPRPWGVMSVEVELVEEEEKKPEQEYERESHGAGGDGSIT